MRSFYGLLVMLELDDDGKFDRRYLPAVVIRATGAFDRAIEEFALVARKHTS